MKHTFSFKDWNKKRRETLSFFGINRFNDWCIVLLLTFFLMIGLSFIGFLSYKDTQRIIETRSSEQKTDISSDARRVEDKIKTLRSLLLVDGVR